MPALWLLGLLALIALSALTAVASAALGVWVSPAERELRDWGVVAADEEVWLYHDHSVDRDGTAGCLAAADALVRWDGRRPTARLPLPGADVDYLLSDRAEVVVRNGGHEIVCPFRLGEGGDRFADALRVAASKVEQRPWGPGRTDPRL